MTIRRALYGFLAFWPLAFMIVILVLFIFSSGGEAGWFGVVVLGGCAISVIGWIAFIVDVFLNPRMPVDRRTVWAALMFFGGPYVMPFYFWNYVRLSGKGPVGDLELC